jgi:hypothetical protein
MEWSMKSGKSNPPQRRRRISLLFMAIPLAAAMGMFLTTAPAGASTAPAASHATQRVSAVHGEAATPESASGCNDNTCISVCSNSSCTGSGLYVDYVVETSNTDEETGCAYGEFLVRGSVRLETNADCWDNDEGTTEYFYDYYSIGYDIDNGSQVCVDYVGYNAPDGKPCETVRS